MTAKEMFEALGWKIVQDDKYIIEYTITKHYPSILIFHLVYKEYHCNNAISVDTNQAITQKMKELGWIE